ncbi:hypothetical protein BU15DRAFT_39031 [Melanogaster broomeanus]|nr:hypothetical protein BU15DRAFT_39031 [Melanogaster broomeanus]
MPVPVPSVSKPTARSIQKCSKAGDSTNLPSSVFQHLKRTLPLSPTGPPASFASRDQWINSLPSWRRTKTRHIWENDSSPPASVDQQGFRNGLVGAVNAPAIKGEHVQACIPPLNPLVAEFPLILPKRHAQTGVEPLPWSVTSTSQMLDGWSHSSDLYLEDEGGLFAPILEDDSPDMMNGDMGSSPLEPLTPFGDYVDRAVAASDATVSLDPLAPNRPQEFQFPYPVLCGAQCYTQCYHLHSHPHVEVKEEPFITATEQAPTASSAYKKLAEPMAEWIVSYVWKVCTNTIVLPQPIVRYTCVNSLAPAPLHLTSAVHSLLMSTLLQPSAILLALWYITRLPVYLGAGGLGPEHVKERRFRVELLGDTHDGVDGDPLEATATFRIIVLGCMLANKWLDDHTFSNKTWHTISNVPVQLLNKLEYFALDVFSHDLSIPPSAWSQWLSHLLSYHHSLSTTTYPQPISRPASNPQSIIRKTIQEIMEAPLGYSSNGPVFLGVEQRLREKFGLSSSSDESFDIDLDKDGPLREEYLPKRRVSNGISSRSHLSLNNQASAALPPPAKWSPAGDEPIYRPSDRTGAIYIPVQAPLAPHYVGPAVYQAWPTASLPYVPLGQHPDVANPLSMSHYPYWAPVNRSAMQQPQPFCASDYYTSNHSRAYSHGGFDYRCGDIRTTSDSVGYHTQPTASWTSLEQYGYVTSRQPLGPHPPLNYRSTWLRA